MKKTYLVVALSLVVSLLFSTPITAVAAVHDFCPAVGGLSGWWGTITPTSRLCGTDFYTWNTNSGLGGEESWFLSSAHYLLCSYSSVQNPGNVSARVYVPSPDYAQTQEGAHYYRSILGGSYSAIGTVPQYYLFGFASLYTEDWGQFDRFKLSDWTNEATKYSKHVDLDAFSLDCYFN